MSLNQNAVKAATEGTNVVRNVANQSENAYAEIIGSAAHIGGKGFFGLGAGASFQGGNTTVGINESQIPAMKTAIKEYINRLNEHLEQVKRDADTSQAFRGDYAAAIKNFVDAVCTSCHYIISNLEAFSDDLDKVLIAYQSKDQSMASDLNSAASGVDGAFTKYTGQSGQ